MDATQARERVGEVETLLARLDELPDPAAREAALSAVSAVLDLYGEALARVVELIGPAQARALAGDELAGHLLLVHGLHPVAAQTRVREALDGVRPYLESHGGDVELLDVDTAGGVVRLRLEGSCDGCPASLMTLKGAIEEAVLAAAPEIARVEAEGLEEHAPPESALLQIECAPMAGSVLDRGRPRPQIQDGGR
jgi:Fe-S cluster biogenesis protein NfuA